MERFVVKVHRIIGTRTKVYSAWSHEAGKIASMVMFEDGVCLGRIGSDPDRSAYDHLPGMSPERREAVMNEYDRRYEVAYQAILSVHPEAAGGRRTMGEIETQIEE